MKKVLVALMCTLAPLAIGACGEKRAEDPSTMRTTTVTSETTTTQGDRSAPSSTTGTTGTSMGTTTPTTGTGATATGTTSGPTGPTITPSPTPTTPQTGTTTVDNPGVAHGTSDADNTKINDRDRHGAVTPTDQGGGKDRDITAAIRRAVVGDKALSFNAKNVKIITEGGKVTLRGPVKSDEEKASIEAKAKSTPGVSVVDNQLEVKK
jgi:hyperosmotically inducible periplasmic protein